MDDFEKARDVFLSDDLDEEEIADNKAKIDEWHRVLVSNKLFLDWQEHEITKSIARQAKDAFKNHAMTLILKRDLPEKDRQAIWAKQDAIKWLLGLFEKDAKGAIEQVEKEIRGALEAV